MRDRDEGRGGGSRWTESLCWARLELSSADLLLPALAHQSQGKTLKHTTSFRSHPHITRIPPHTEDQTAGKLSDRHWRSIRQGTLHPLDVSSGINVDLLSFSAVSLSHTGPSHLQGSPVRRLLDFTELGGSLQDILLDVYI